MNRRQFLAAATLGLSGCASPRRTVSPAAAGTPLPQLAFSLRRLQDELSSGPSPLARALAGLNRFDGFLTEDNDVVVFGGHDPAAPPLDVEDLAIALRNAYGMPGYEGVIGCTIDPLPGVPDPWLWQTARIFGMPRNASMGVRHLAVDYDLKKISAGLLRLAGVESTYDFRRGDSHCRQEAIGAANSVHRFWFTPLYPSAGGPRFVQDAAGVGIQHPIGVQLMSEEEFLRDGRRVGAAPPHAAARQFCASVTRVLSANTSLPHARMRHDFRIIELARLFAFKHVSPDRLSYLLRDLPLAARHTPEKLPGVRRDDHGSIHCGLDTVGSGDTSVVFGSSQHVERYHREYRGGVEAGVRIAPAEFAPGDGYLDAVRRRVQGATRDDLAWRLA